MLCKEFRQIFHASPIKRMRVKRYSKIVSDHDVLVQFLSFDNKEVEVVVEFGSASRYVKLCYLRVTREDLEATLDGLTSHHLGPFRSGIDMAVFAGLITQLTDIHLQRLNA